LYPPTNAEVLGVQDNVAECKLARTPDPESEMMVGEFVASLATMMLPVTVPATVGLKVTFNVVFCPGARIIPGETPLAVNPAPEILTLEIDTLEFPALVNVIPMTLLPPRTTLPKLRLAELAFRSEVAATPVPLTLTLAGDFEALLMTETAPEILPNCFGENTTFSVDCPPAPIVIGRDIPVTANPRVEILSCVTDRFDPPVFDTVIDCETTLPTATDPKLMDEGDTAMAALPGVFCFCWPDGFVALVRPTQPEIESVPRASRPRASRRIRPATVFNEVREFADSQRNQRMIVFVINGTIVRGRAGRLLLSLSTNEGQAWNLSLKREAINRKLCQ